MAVIIPLLPYNLLMHATLKEMLSRRPFVAFEIHMSSGEVYQIRHPDNAILLRTNLLIGFPRTDRFALCALLHISEIRTLQAA